MYLCGFTLFLSLILNRTYVMILDILRLEEEVKNNRAGAAGKEGNTEVAKLKKELEAKDRDIANLKKQADGLTREYNRLGDEKSPADSTPKKDR